MRCKHCDKRLEPSQYRWDAEAKEWKENCEGRCVGYVPRDVADAVEEVDTDEDPEALDERVTWVPAGE
jgi:hypothetical protein